MTSRTEAELAKEVDVAAVNAIKALAGYKFMMFGYWAGIWVHLNRIGHFRRPNPFKRFVLLAREIIAETSRAPADPSPTPLLDAAPAAREAA